MYLSKVILPARAASNPYEWHRSLWALFPRCDDKTRDFLFRVEGRAPGGVMVLLQSAEAPLNEPARVVATRSFTLRLHAGQRLRFRLTANPVKTLRDQQGRTNARGEVKSCRVPLIREEEQLAWLARKLAPAARLETAQIAAQEILTFRKAGKPGKLAQVTFDGILQVDAPDALHQQVQLGIGHGKSFGCGLLSLAAG